MKGGGVSLEPKVNHQAGFSVDLIRSIAIVLIIVVHSSGFPYHFPTAQIQTLDIVNWFSTDVALAIGNVGVPLFVMLGGALLLTPAKADEPLREFYKKRFDRIGVPFIFWTIFYFIWAFRIQGKPLTLFSIEQGLLTGSNPILWYLYLIMGLYAVTPILRVLVKHIDRKLFTLLLALWFTGTITTPFIHTFTDFSYSSLTFVFLDWVGYYLLGIYLLSANFKKSTAYMAAALGLLVAILGDWMLEATMGESATGFFHGYLSFNMIIGTAAIFFLLLSVPPSRIQSHAKTNRVIHWISQNTLSIYLIHIVFLETFTAGYLGFYLNRFTWNLAVDIPIFVLIVFGCSAGTVFLLKKIPYVSKVIG